MQTHEPDLEHDYEQKAKKARDEALPEVNKGRDLSGLWITLWITLMIALATTMVCYASEGPRNWIASKVYAQINIPVSLPAPTATKVVQTRESTVVAIATTIPTPTPKPLAQKPCNGYLVSYFNETGHLWSDVSCIDNEIGRRISFGIPELDSYEIDLDTKQGYGGIVCQGIGDNTTICFVEDFTLTDATIMVSIKPNN